MTLALDAFAARLPELGTSPRHAFLLLDVAGRRPQSAPYRAPDDAAPQPGASHPHGPRAPICIALAIDASSSMRGPRFAIAVQAARDVVESLTPADRVAVVTFERGARVVLPPTAIDAEGKAEARRTLDRLATASGTNVAAGWREAADAMSRLMVPGAARRILMLTDGMPSVGERDANLLAKMVGEGRARGLETSVVGIGDGIDEKLCAQLARAGDGRFYYLRNEGMLGDVVAHEIDGARRLAATDVNLVLALSMRVQRAEVLHRYPCQIDGRTFEIRIGAVSYETPRSALLQLEIEDPASEAILGAAVARGRAVMERKFEPTMEGYALGARSTGDGDADRESASERVSLMLQAGLGPEDARRRVAREVLAIRTLAEVRSAWDGFDARDYEAVARRLGRARDIRATLEKAGLIDASAVASLPDVAAIEAAMLGHGPDVREARRDFASWAHNTQNSQIIHGFRKDPDKHEP